MISTFLGAQTVTTASDDVQNASDGTENIFSIFLDDVGCSGSEKSLLDCLPQHNCVAAAGGLEENARVKCLRHGACSG